MFSLLNLCIQVNHFLFHVFIHIHQLWILDLQFLKLIVFIKPNLINDLSELLPCPIKLRLHVQLEVLMILQWIVMHHC